MRMSEVMRALAALRPLVPAARRAKMAAVLAARTHAARIVLENLADPHNGAACLRVAEGLGIHTVHVVHSYETFHMNANVAASADKWLDVRFHANNRDCLDSLRADGYRVLASDLKPGAQPLPRRAAMTPTAPKLALVFGNEYRGISPFWSREADGLFVLPMTGFVQSFNISTSVAMSLYHLRLDGFLDNHILNEAERDATELRWLQRDVRSTLGRGPGSAAVLVRH